MNELLKNTEKSPIRSVRVHFSFPKVKPICCDNVKICKYFKNNYIFISLYKY
jgi:hypothetical protein